MFRYLILILLATIVGFVGFWLLIPRSSSYGMFEGETSTNLLRIALSYTATLSGVALGSVYRYLRKLQSLGQDSIENVSALLRYMLRSLDLWIGVASSPIVFALLLQSTSGMNLSGLLVIALQNGFCCLIIIDQLTSSKHDRSGDAKSPKDGPTHA